MRATDIAGKKFGTLTALYFFGYGSSKSHAKWIVRCDCGVVFPTYKSHLVTGAIKQCTECGHKTQAARVTTHGRSKTSEYMTFHAAKNRCDNISDARYKDYGGRGIRFMLKSIEEMIGEIGTRPAGKSLDRIDNDGDYTTGNIKWSTPEEQAKNRRRKFSDENREID